MTDKSQSHGKAEREADKARRLAEALRANLARRKTRRRSIAEAEAAGDGGAGTAEADGSAERKND
jgi:hypothetical protein